MTLDILDQDGYLFIVGRIKDIINRGGQRLRPPRSNRRCRATQTWSKPPLSRSSIGRLGEDVAAAVVLRQDAKVSAHSLRDFARERLARFKVPALIRIVPEIPKGPAGKIKRADSSPRFQ